MERIIKLAHEICEDKTLKLDENTSIVLDMELSSMEILAFITEVEDAFGVRLSERMLNRIDTLGDLYEMVEEQRKR